MKRTLLLAVLMACMLLSGAVAAQQLENPRTDYAAYTRPKGRMAVGPFKVEHGIIDEIMVGTHPLPWFAFPFLGVPIPNGYLKLRTSWFEPLTFSVRGGLTYIDAKALAELADDSAEASALSVTSDFTASWKINEKFSLSAGFDYAHISAIGSSKDEAANIEGASTADTYSVRLFGEWRFTRVFAMTLLTRYLIYQSPIDTSSSTETDAVSVDTDLSAESTEQRHFSIVPGVSFAWEHWELSGGVGYGIFYLPMLGLATAKRWPILDLSFAYRFDLYH
ncbi:MAG TPA: hypothetical protein VNN72_20730 [Polyangiaceae bacterium]|nr:hypothetical protein [Polyangiaceae bacterium]